MRNCATLRAVWPTGRPCLMTRWRNKSAGGSLTPALRLGFSEELTWRQHELCRVDLRRFFRRGARHQRQTPRWFSLEGATIVRNRRA
eukprot:5411847-Pleurochrysis_carterae.AAC.1